MDESTLVQELGSSLTRRQPRVTKETARSTETDGCPDTASTGEVLVERRTGEEEGAGL